MKNAFLITLLFSAVFQMALGQAVPNGSLENWNSVPYQEPNDWFTGNPWALQGMGVAVVSRVTGQSGFGVRMETKIIGNDTSMSYIVNTQGDPSNGDGGTPYSQQPTALTGYCRYNLPGNDSALLWVIFKNSGTIIYNQFFFFKGTGSQPAWTAFSFPISLPGAPDSVIFAAASSNLVNGGIQNGSFLELDQLTFTGPGITQQLTNNNFENWTSLSYDLPVDWVTWGQGFSRTSSSYAGNYAARMETMDMGGGEYQSSGMTTGHMTDTAGPAGGRPYTGTQDTLCGYYKFASANGDSAGIYLSLTKNGANVGGNYRVFHPAANYTYFEMPFNAGMTPDTMRVDLISSNWPATATSVGSVFYADNLYLKSSALGIFDPAPALTGSTAYPNPASDLLWIRLDGLFQKVNRVVVYDADGRKLEIPFRATGLSTLQLDVSSLVPGVYVYDLNTNSGGVRNRFIVQ